jgi:hypothetical protein
MQTTAAVAESGDGRIKRQVRGRIALPREPGTEHWIQGGGIRRGALHAHLGIPAAQKIPAKRLTQAAHSQDPTIRREANLAETFKHMQRGKH